MLSTTATEKRLTEFSQSSGLSIMPLQQISASFRCRPVYSLTLDLVKGGCNVFRCKWYLGPQRSHVSVGDQPILEIVRERASLAGRVCHCVLLKHDEPRTVCVVCSSLLEELYCGADAV